ncbi:LOW QUALITY PROTEIN: acylamino-acid-releasing enzyme-like [Lycium ferocissimum]|uniref:LOW QUALITY PROTEIN: acylamino-acid-releasing enzyme-like n=1 Tax=Lycium ferocissimum TaxID=112874 RepID=UPI002815D286|nr:LOW QUALITY PROTEIN: acylamino-acid-releasing enzyme-like [Lycium ferocissimum]
MRNGRSRSLSICSAMENAEASPLKRFPLGLDETSEEEYSSQSALIQDFASIPTIDKAWTFTSTSGSQCMFSVSQPNLLANKNRRYVVSSHISKESANGLSFQWAAFPIEMPSGSIMVPSPSGSKLLVVRNPEKDSLPTKFEIWGPSQVEKEFHISPSVHGSVYSDGWFEGISWNDDETFVAYVAEEPAPLKPVFTNSGYKKGNSSDKECGSWKGQGDWEEDWGETYPGKREPAIFVINVNSGEVYPVEGTKKLTVGQVVWAPASGSLQHYLVFVGWPSDTRKLGIKYCYNRPCALYAVRAPFSKPEDRQSESNAVEEASPVKLTQRISSAFVPRFSPDRKGLVFLSAKSSVASFVMFTCNSHHFIDLCCSIDGLSSPWHNLCDPLIVVLHGGPHFISLSSFSKSLAFLSAIGYSLLIVNYRGSSGFGEEALQSLPGKIGSQVLVCRMDPTLAAIDHVIDMGLADPSKITVLGGSHGGFLTTHLTGQAPDKFAAAATRNPVCSIPLMVGTSDIPDWCYAETFGCLGKSMFTEAPSSEHLAVFHSKSPISYISKVKTPILFLLGAKDLRVPVCTGLQYARALKEKGTEVKVLVFPEDNHAIDRPQSDFESFLNIGVWFKKHCK